MMEEGYVGVGQGSAVAHSLPDHPWQSAASAANLRSDLLIVDDARANQELLRDILEQDGHRVRAVMSGRAALEAARLQTPDLVLLDIEMPEMDGYRVCEEFKRDPRLRAIPILFISGLDHPLDKVKAFGVGGVDYIVKPFSVEEVSARVASHLALHRITTDLERHNRDLAIVVREQVQEISDSQMATILALSALAESRDDATGQHLSRVQEYCRCLTLGLRSRGHFPDEIDEGYVENIVWASPLHDIGKVGIPDSILLKADRLTAEELAVMKTHTLIGARTLESVRHRYPRNAFIAMGVEVARSHHERWDGSGYPDGLTGAAIPLAARILAVADQYDALRNERPYKAAFEHRRSVEIMVRGDGRTEPGHFDPLVLEVFEGLADDFEAIYERLRS